MKSSWVHNVWDINIEENVPVASNTYDSDKALALYNLRIMPTGFAKKEKEEIKKYTADAGGIYHTEYCCKYIDVVIAHKEAKSTDKFKKAQKDKIPCVSIEWIRTSVDKGTAQPFDAYTMNESADSGPDSEADRAIEGLAEFIAKSKAVHNGLANASDVGATCSGSN